MRGTSGGGSRRRPRRWNGRQVETIGAWLPRGSPGITRDALTRARDCRCKARPIRPSMTHYFEVLVRTLPPPPQPFRRRALIRFGPAITDPYETIALGFCRNPRRENTRSRPRSTSVCKRRHYRSTGRQCRRTDKTHPPPGTNAEIPRPATSPAGDHETVDIARYSHEIPRDNRAPPQP